MVRPPTDDERALWERAVAARERAYAPYSKFLVGAALKTGSGAVVTGGNIENSSFGMTICAERSAVVRALAEGESGFVAIAVAGNPDTPDVAPCGACRQVLVEFCAPDMPVIYVRGGDLISEPLGELFPAAFLLRSQP